MRKKIAKTKLEIQTQIICRNVTMIEVSNTTKINVLTGLPVTSESLLLRFLGMKESLNKPCNIISVVI